MRLKFFFNGLFLFAFSALANAQILQPFESTPSLNYTQSKSVYDLGLIRFADFKLERLKNLSGYAAEDKKLILEAEIEFENGSWDIAEQKLAHFIETRDNSPLQALASYQRAVINFVVKRYDRAEFYFDQARKLAEESAVLRNDPSYDQLVYSSFYWRGVSFYNIGKLQEAKQSFELCQLKYPKNPMADDALFALGLIAEQTQKNDDAVAYYKKVRTLYPERNNYLICLAREASNYLVLRNPSSAMIQLERAESAWEQIQLQENRSKDSTILYQYEKQSYIEEIPNLLLFLRAESSNLANNFAASISYYKNFIDRYLESPLLLNAKFGLGFAQLNKGELKDAIVNFNEVITKAGDKDWKTKAAAQLYRAIALKRSGDTEQAKKEFSALASINGFPYLSLALIELGQIYYEERDFLNSQKTLEKADREAQDPVSTVRAKILLGVSQMELTNWDKAVTEFREARTIAENTSQIVMPDRQLYIFETFLKEGIVQVQNQKSNEAINVLNNFISKAGKDPRKSEGIFWLAEAYYRSDLLTNAIETYESLYNSNSVNERKEEILYGLGWSYFRKKQFSKSSQYFDQLLKEFPNSKFGVEVLTRQGDGYYLEKNYSKAAESYTRAAKLRPDTEEGQYSAYQLCHALYRGNKLDQAVNSLLDFVRKYSKSQFAPNAMYLTGWIKFQQKKYKEAIENYNFLIDAYPQSGLIARTHYAIGDAYFNQENYEKATISYKVVIDNYPSSDIAPEAMRGVQQCLELTGREEEAVQILNNYTEKNADSPFYREFKEKAASILFDNRKYKDAISEYENMINKTPDSPKNVESIYWIGKSYVGMANYDEADKTFIKLIQKYPKSEQAPLALLERGLLKKKLNDAKAADEILLELSNKYPENIIASQAIFERAIMKYAIGDTAGSMSLYNELADKYDRSEYATESRYRVAKYLKNTGKLDSSKAQFEKLANVVSNQDLSAEARYRIGEIEVSRGNLDSALANFDIVKEKFSGIEDWFSLSMLAMAEIYEKQSNTAKAIECYNIILSLRPEDDFGKTAKQRIKTLKKD